MNSTTSSSEPSITPDPEVVLERAVRRRFSATYKLQILAEAEKCTGGELGGLLRREGLYASHLSTWRKQRMAGELAGLAPQKRGRKAGHDRTLVQQNEKLQRENARLQKRLEQAELIISVQKKVAQLLGNPIQSAEPVDENS